MNCRFLLLMALALVLAGCGKKSPDAQTVAAEFFRQISSGESGAAYASTSEYFRLTKSQQHFEARAKEWQLDKATVEWSAPEPVGETIRVPGTFTRPKGGSFKLFATLKKSRAGWQVLEVRHVRPGAKKGGEDIFEVDFREPDLADEKARALGEPVQATMPNQNQLKEMVNKVMTDFNAGIQEKDFKAFFESTAERWRYRGKSPTVLNYIGPDPERTAASDPENRDRRLTLGTIKTEFQRFVDQKIDLGSILGKKIVFDAEPAVSSEGVLALEGHYEDYFFTAAKVGEVPQPYRLSFKVEFFYENSGWRLFGFHPNIHVPHGPGK